MPKLGSHSGIKGPIHQWMMGLTKEQRIHVITTCFPDTKFRTAYIALWQIAVGTSKAGPKKAKAIVEACQDFPRKNRIGLQDLRPDIWG